MGPCNTAVRLLTRLAALYLCACLVLGVITAEQSLRQRKHPIKNPEAQRLRLQQKLNAQVSDASITASDGAILKGWFLQPAIPNGKSVIILHGITSSRLSTTGFAQMFLARGYSVLTPDSRDHGESGGDIVTYGVLERDDVRRWTQWLRARAPGCTYLLGESLGAAIGLQATEVTPDLCAVVVESPFATFREIAYEHLGRNTRKGTLFWKTLGRPILAVTIAYTRVRYGIYLPDADPKVAVEHASTPTLLIAGTADHNIPMHHAQELAAACPSHCTLWIIPGADHGEASSVAHGEFDQRVLGWFTTHDR